MKVNHNVVGWFEIPVHEMERAIRFYESVFDYKLIRQQMGELDMAWFPSVPDAIGSGGSLVQSPDFYKPSQQGPLVYFTAFSGDLNHELMRVEKAGGKIVQPKTEITPDIGFMAVIIDSEGNRIALHSRK
ncbi:MAG: VOC family protein [Bacteroidetes bacterium]|nr:VOC family protein [Bacteroidota bacterium]